MEIQRTNTSPSFRAMELSAKEGRQVAKILRQYKQQANPALKKQLVDIFAPHFEQEAELYEGIIKQDFIQDLYVKLFENIEKVNLKYHPSAVLVKKINSVKPTKDNVIANFKSIETLTDAEKSKLLYEEELLERYDAENLIKKSILTPRYQYILLSQLKGKSSEEIGNELKITAQRVNIITKNAIRILNFDPQKFKMLKADFEINFEKANTPKSFMQRLLDNAKGILDNISAKSIPRRSNINASEEYKPIKSNTKKN